MFHSRTGVWMVEPQSPGFFQLFLQPSRLGILQHLLQPLLRDHPISMPRAGAALHRLSFLGLGTLTSMDWFKGKTTGHHGWNPMAHI